MKYFSTKVAKYDVFCDRDIERAEIWQKIEQGEHCVIVAPRRYGKTSLVMRVLEEKSVVFACIDLFCVVYEEDVTRKIAKGVSLITQQLMSKTENTLTFLESVFKSARVGLRTGKIDISVDFSRNTSVIEHIEDLLAGLEQIAAKTGKKAVIFFDEFQDILKVERSMQLQAAIRSIAQHSENITYIFSGSSRVMLEKIFEDSNQPLYMMCHKVLLNRIAKEDLLAHMQIAAKDKWQQELSDEVALKLLELCESHTFYYNALLCELFSEEKLPSLEDAYAAWLQVLQKHKGKLISELERLNANRLKVLTTVAFLDEVNAPNSRDFLEKVKLSLSSTQVATQYLLQNDYLMQTDSGGLRIVDPLLKFFIKSRHK